MHRERRSFSARLEHGDFQHGADRILLRVRRRSAALRHVHRRSERARIQLPQIGAVSLDSLLRGELKDRMQTTLSRYFRSPVVTVTPLVTMLVEGEVARPGFYAARARASV